ncbi:MAG TPA: SIR2 family protein, partial [Cellvibrionaceae bacterium]|nr:SIR2 family protein [Cellvibrionaceae bacterium]
EYNRPFTMLTGAGCSKSAGIPLADELVAEIHNKFGQECKYKLDENQIMDYGACMGCLSKNERRDLLSPYLNNSKINWAHIAIASLMHSGFVGRVITFNFDSILARACGLIGLYPATYDFAAAATVDTDYIAPQAIIHLHGQGWGKSLLNSDQETSDHVENIRPLIRSVLQDSPLLVVGYSGLSDPVFSVISEEYSGRERLWWAGYSPNPNDSVKNLIENHKRLAQYLGGCDADDFLISLAKELKCFPPLLFKNPYSHIINEIKPIMDFPLVERDSADLLTRLKHELAASETAFNRQANIPELLMNKQWTTAIEKIDPVTPELQRYLAWAYTGLGGTLISDGKMQADISAIEAGIEKQKKALELIPDFYPALHNIGEAYLQLGKFTKDPAHLEESIKIFNIAASKKPDKADTLCGLGCASSELGKIKNDETLALFGINKIRDALKIEPDSHKILNNLGACQLNAFSLTKNNSFLDEAKITLEKAEKIDPNGAYNLACLYSILNRKEECMNLLFRCKQAGTLPNRGWLISDLDLNNVKGDPRFAELIET